MAGVRGGRGLCTHTCNACNNLFPYRFVVGNAVEAILAAVAVLPQLEPAEVEHLGHQAGLGLDRYDKVLVPDVSQDDVGLRDVLELVEPDHLLAVRMPV